MAELRPKYKLIVSDFHLGKGRFFKNGTQNILEDFVYDREFSEFLYYYRTGSYAEADVELILNGDILNLLQIDIYGVHTHLMTERGVARAVEKIISGHPDFFSALRKFASTAGHSISYIVGNHDVGMLYPKARELFSKAVGSPMHFYDVHYRFNGVHVEHGQQYETFAGIDMDQPFISRGLPEPVLNLPWGSLFVAVLLPKIKQGRPHIDKVRPFSAFLRWVVIHDLIWGIQTAYKVIKFVLQTILFKTRFQIRRGVRGTFKMLKEISLYPNYDRIAFKILEENEDIHTVIFGHTHILRYRQWREGKEYFNEGTWNETTNLDLADYGKQIRLTYAFVEYPRVSDEAHIPTDPSVLKPKVRLKQWNGTWKPENEIIV